MAEMTTPQQYFQQMLDNPPDQTAGPEQDPNAQSQIPPDMAGAGAPPPDQQLPNQGMSFPPANPDDVNMLDPQNPSSKWLLDLVKGEKNWQFIHDLGRLAVPDLNEKPLTKTPWQAKVIGGIADALSIFSQTRRPRPLYQTVENAQGRMVKVKVGYSPIKSVAPPVGAGYLTAMAGTRGYNANLTMRQNRQLEKRAAFEDQMAGALGSRAIAEMVNGSKSDIPPQFKAIDYLVKNGIMTVAESQRGYRILTPGTPDYNLAQQTKKRSSAKELLDKITEGMNDPDNSPEERAAFKAMHDAHIQNITEEAAAKEGGKLPGQKELKAAVSGGTAVKPPVEGELNANAGRAMNAELKPFQDDEKMLRTNYKKIKDDNDAKRGAKLVHLLDLPGENAAKKALDANLAKQAAIRKAHGIAGPPASYSQTEGWSAVRVK